MQSHRILRGSSWQVGKLRPVRRLALNFALVACFSANSLRHLSESSNLPNSSWWRNLVEWRYQFSAVESFSMLWQSRESLVDVHGDCSGNKEHAVLVLALYFTQSNSEPTEGMIRCTSCQCQMYNEFTDSGHPGVQRSTRAHSQRPSCSGDNRIHRLERKILRHVLTFTSFFIFCDGNLLYLANSSTRRLARFYWDPHSDTPVAIYRLKGSRIWEASTLP